MASDRQTSGLTTALILRYVRSRGGDDAVVHALKLANENRPEAELLDESGWSSYAQKISLFQAASFTLKDPMVARRVGETVLEHQVGNTLKVLLRALGTPGQVLRNASRAAAKFSTVCTMETVESTKGRAVIRYRLKDGFPPHRMDCDYNIGLLSQVPVLFGLPPATVIHTECQVRGASHCVYKVKWVPQSRLIRKNGKRRVAYLEDQLQTLSQRTEALQTSMEDLVSPAEIETVLERICNRAAKTVGAQAYLFAVKSFDGRRPLVYHDGLSDDSFEALGAELLDGMFETTESVLVVDVASARSHYGRLAALNPAGGAFFPEEEKLLATYARHAALALDIAAALDEARRRAAENEFQALHDALTGLPNRSLFGDRVGQAVLAGERQGEPVAVVMMDIDRFKEINETLGHHCGDLVLQQVARRLLDVVRRSDTVARLGGDEFAILLHSVESADRVAELAARVNESFREPFVVDDLSLSLAATFGVALYPEHGSDVNILMQRAEVAMYVAKSRQTGYEIYSSDEDDHSPGRLALAGELREAIAQRQLVVHYQPIEGVKGRLAVEALVRWQHPYRGLLAPAEFIPLAEHSGLIKPLTSFVLDEALKQRNAWSKMDIDVDVAVNLSARTLFDSSLPEEVEGLLAKWEVDARKLVLEITEGEIMADPRRARQVLLGLNALGVRLAIDDFGTGSSSLKDLKYLPIDQIKVDKSFVLGMTTNEADRTIVKTIIDLARNLGMEVVAEGVETEEVYNQVLEMQCDLVQGFFLSHPLPADDLTPQLMERAATLVEAGR